MKITPDHLLDLSFRAARRGNTRAMAQAAQASNATCYTITEREAARVRREYGVEARSLSGYRPDQEIGRRTPVLLDVAVLPAIAEAWSAEVGAAEQRARQVADELETSKAAHAADQRLLQRALAELEKLRSADLSADMRELVAHVRRLDSAATPGPFDVFGHERSSLCHVETDADAPAAGIVICSINKEAQNGRGEANALALAYCRNAAPILATEVETVETQRDEARENNRQLRLDIEKSRLALAAERGRLGARLAEVERERNQASNALGDLQQRIDLLAADTDAAAENPIVSILARVRGLKADLNETRLALAAEHGRQEGAPSSEWRWTGKVWFHPPTCMVVEPADRLWRLNPDAGDPRHWRLSRLEPMPARDAMKTADAPN